MLATTQEMQAQIRENARLLNEIYEKIHHNEYDSHVFFSKFDELAWPGGLTEGKRRLRHGDPGEIETAICYLEENPCYYRSSDIKSDVMRILCRHDLDDRQMGRLGRAICQTVDSRLGREIVACGRLARKISHPQFIAHLTDRLNSDNIEVRQRAQSLVRAMR